MEFPRSKDQERVVSDPPPLALGFVTFLHPGYPNERILLNLPAWDKGSNGGLHAGTALLACAIVSCNAFDGYFSRDQQGSQRLAPDRDALLPPGTYYFHVPRPDTMGDISGPYKYPICPTFWHWPFPHGRLPPEWSNLEHPIEGVRSIERNVTPASGISTTSSSVTSRDQMCVVSHSGDVLECAHLCPHAELAWFTANGMRRYNSNPFLPAASTIDDPRNAIALRLDIHRLFDNRVFVLARKRGSWVVHFLKPTTNLGRSYHDVKVTIARDVSPEFLLARFAWAIFPSMECFWGLEDAARHLIRLRRTENGRVLYCDKTLTTQDAKLAFCRETMTQTSPQKRKRTVDAIAFTSTPGVESDLTQEDEESITTGSLSSHENDEICWLRTSLGIDPPERLSGQ